MFWAFKLRFVADILAFFDLATFWAILWKIWLFFLNLLVTLMENEVKPCHRLLDYWRALQQERLGNFREISKLLEDAFHQSAAEHLHHSQAWGLQWGRPQGNLPQQTSHLHVACVGYRQHLGSHFPGNHSFNESRYNWTHDNNHNATAE